MSRRFSFFLLLLLLINIAGFYGYFLVRLNQLHEESREALKNLPETELEHFVLTPESYKNAIVNKREVLINGKMYDVAKVSHEAGKIHVFALHDEAEDDLLAFIEEVMDNAGKDGQAPSVFSYFTSLNFLKSGFNWIPDSEFTPVTHDTGFLFNVVCCGQSVTSPPPRLV